MRRKDFLKALGVTGAAATVMPLSESLAKKTPPTDCVLIPSETAGPFPLDLTANTSFFRQDIREQKTGASLNVKMKIFGLDNCAPMQNVRINIWHCDKDGLYSGYSQSNNQGQAGLSFFCGEPNTDANGEVNFCTVFSSWYNGRILPIHFQVYVSSSYSAVSQMTFDIAKKNAVYAANSSLYTKGADPLNYSQDNIFSDGYAYQLAALTDNEETGGYNAYLEVSVKGSGTTGLGHLEREAAKHFQLGQNYPNPFAGLTSIPVNLVRLSEVQLDLYNLNGQKVAGLYNGLMPAGSHIIQVSLNNLGLPMANYAYQIQVKNDHGSFTDCKLMTISK